VLALPAAGDALSDLRAVLQRYPATSPITVSASLNVKGDTQDKTATRAGSTTLEVDAGPAGFTIHVPPATLAAAVSEAAAKKHDPESRTPTRNAMVALTIFDLIDSIDAASMLLNDLSGATLIDQRPSTHAGQPATLLHIKVKSTLAGTSSRLVNEPKVDLRVWIDANGVPIAAERDSNFSASVLFIKAANVRKERWELAVSGDRLYASRSEQSNRANALGKSAGSSRSLVCVPMPSQ
jgi:hypothetical protein